MVPNLFHHLTKHKSTYTANTVQTITKTATTTTNWRNTVIYHGTIVPLLVRQTCLSPYNSALLTYTTVHAIRQSCRAGGDWMGAPDGWNKEHEPCLKTQKKCDIHAGIQGMSIQEQRNKKYPEKPRVREKSNRGSGNLKKRGNDSDLLQQASRCSARADSTTRWNYA